MALIGEWLDLMPQTISYRPVASRDAYGKPVFGTAVSYRARVVYKSRRVIDRSTGQEAISSGDVWISGVIMALRVDDEVTLPDGTKPTIVNWDTLSDETGVHHTKITFGGATSGGTRE